MTNKQKNRHKEMLGGRYYPVWPGGKKLLSECVCQNTGGMRNLLPGLIEQMKVEIKQSN